MTEGFTVSVVIPFYNARDYVTQAVESALSQPETGEVLLIEDGSPDGGVDVCQALAKKHSKVRLLRHADGKNHGAAVSRNLGIKCSAFPFVAFLDADDYYLPNRFTLSSKLLQKDLSVDGVYNAMGAIFESEKDLELFQSTSLKEITTVTRIIQPETLFEEMIKLEGRAGYFHLNTLTVRKELLLQVGMFNEKLKLLEDTELMFKIAALGSLVPGDLENPVAIRRVHGGNRITFHMVQKRKQFEKEIETYTLLLEWGKENLDKNKQSLIALRLVDRLRKADYFDDCKIDDFLTSRRMMFKVAKGYPQLMRNHWFWRMVAPSKYILRRK